MQVKENEMSKPKISNYVADNGKAKSNAKLT